MLPMSFTWFGWSCSFQETEFRPLRPGNYLAHRPAKAPEVRGLGTGACSRCRGNDAPISAGGNRKLSRTRWCTNPSEAHKALTGRARIFNIARTAQVVGNAIIARFVAICINFGNYILDLGFFLPSKHPRPVRIEDDEPVAVGGGIRPVYWHCCQALLPAPWKLTTTGSGRASSAWGGRCTRKVRIRPSNGSDNS